MSNETKNNYSEEEIVARVKEIAGEIVMMDSEEISNDSSVIDDLGMESIDFLDLVFRLEKQFGISLPRQDPVRRIMNKLGPERFINEGKFTGDGVKLLKILFPEQAAQMREGMEESELPSFITIQSYVDVVKRGLKLHEWRPEKCDQCGAAEYEPQDKDNLEFPDGEYPLGPVFRCKSCDHLLISPSFEEEVLKKF